MTGHPRQYAVRRVNPLEGVLQVVEHDRGRAYSPNGRAWQIQVLAERPSDTWRGASPIAGAVQYFNFGTWHPELGLHRIPANPVMNIGAMIGIAASLAEVLGDAVAALPFALIDEHECWAVDQRGEPVALLASTRDPALIDEIRVGRWRATRVEDHGFLSSSLQAKGIGARPRAHASRLEQMVHSHTGQRRWFRRLADGSGQALDPGAAEAAHPAIAFPGPGLRRHWDSAAARDLVSDYLAWRAPALLTLQGLDDAERRTLEQAAFGRPAELRHHWRLIPRVLDIDGLKAARVQARLQQTVDDLAR